MVGLHSAIKVNIVLRPAAQDTTIVFLIRSAGIEEHQAAKITIMRRLVITNLVQPLGISPAGRKLWRLKYRFDGKEKRLALGTYPQITLAEARERRDKESIAKYRSCK